jgi:hypothetical protein
MINIRPDEISSIIREQIEKYDQDVKVMVLLVYTALIK